MTATIPPVRLRQLEYFVTVWDCRSFSGAAARLYVAQPSLSQQVKALEEELGAELLERGRHGLALTPAGRAFLPRARVVLQAAQAAADAVTEVVEGREGDVQVLTVRSVASGILPTSIAAWHTLHPSTVLRLHDYSHRRELEDALRSNTGDIAIGPRPTTWDGPLQSLGFEELMVVGSEASLGTTGRLSIESLRDAEWVLYEQEQGMSEVMDWLSDSLGIAPRAVARTAQVAPAMQLAIEGVGLALVPENVVPMGWAQRARRIGAGAYREIVVYSREHPPELARQYWELLASVNLPLTPADGVPPDALRC